MSTTHETIERLASAWDGDIEELIRVLQLLNRIRNRGMALEAAKTRQEIATLRDEVDQLRVALLYVANNDRWEGVPRLREFALQALGEQEPAP